MKRALLVGIDDYPGIASDLESCINDIDEWASILMERYGFTRENIRLLVNERATKAEVIKRLKWLKSGVRNGDTLVFLYSGHGTTFTERDEFGQLDEAKDEALCLYGARVGDMLIDDELSQIFSNISLEVHLTIICDSCFSGGMGNPIAMDVDPGKLNKSKYFALPYDLKHRNDPNSPTRTFGYCLSQKEGLGASNSQNPSPSKSLLLAACQENERALVGSPETEGLSVFSFYATRALRSSDNKLTARQLIKRVVQDIASAGNSQTPQLKGREDLFDKPLFV